MVSDTPRRPPAAVALGAFALLITACSAPPPAARPLNQTVENTSWIGSCRGLDVGTYVFTFGPATEHRGIVEIQFPDAVKGTQIADYAVTYANGGQQLTVNLAPPWTGQFIRDAKNLNWDVRVGDSPKWGLCRLWEAGTATD